MPLMTSELRTDGCANRKEALGESCSLSLRIDQGRFRCGRCSEGYYQLGLSCQPCGSDTLVRFLARGVPIMAVVFGTAILYIACKFSPPSGFFVVKLLQQLEASRFFPDLGMPVAECSSFEHSAALDRSIDRHGRTRRTFQMHCRRHQHAPSRLRARNAHLPSGPADGNLGDCRLAVPCNN
jgi:hypothetical protein